MMEETGASFGTWACAGSLSATAGKRSATDRRAWFTSMSQSNSTHTTANPTVAAERTRRTPGAPLTAASSGTTT